MINNASTESQLLPEHYIPQTYGNEEAERLCESEHDEYYGPE